MKLYGNETVVTDDVSGRQIIVDTNTWNSCGKNVDAYFSHKNNINGLKAIRNRASIEQVVNFANAVREAGGGSLIEELLPSVPEEPNSCLVANALNFDCDVNSHAGVWYMEIYESEKGIDIAEQLDLEYDAPKYLDYVDDETGKEHYAYEGGCEIYLPEEIGLVAEAFDTWADYELEEFNSSRIEE
jgi:hypothetical protein